MEIRQQFETIPILADMDMNLKRMEDLRKSGEDRIGLKIAKWVTPMGLLPLSVYADTHGIHIDASGNRPDVCSYLDTICFPEGTSDPVHHGRTYLPITRLSCTRDDETLTRYEDMILWRIRDRKIRRSFRNSLKYLTTEMVTNVREHAGVERYWISAQYWPATETCEIAIADAGRGYRESYRGTRHEVSNHWEAIRNAVMGISSKDDVERGTGIPGTVNLFCQGYGGELVLMSGDALLHMTENMSDFYRLRTEWQGAFIDLRFKLKEINTLAYLGGY